MFYYVDGTVSVLQQGLAVIDCGGVGVGSPTFQKHFFPATLRRTPSAS